MRKFLLFLALSLFLFPQLYGQDDGLEIRKKGKVVKKQPPPIEKTLPVAVEAQANYITIQGRVSETHTGVLVGATVSVVEGTEAQAPIQGTFTDENGNFYLKIPNYKAGLKLKVQYIGMKPYLKPIQAGVNNYNVLLEEDAIGLEEVVVTALNIKEKKVDVGYAIQEIKAVDVLRAGEPNLVQALAAKIAGVQVIASSGMPGASSTILIRGGASITGQNQPLFIIDGIPVDNSTNIGGDPNNGNNNWLEGVGLSNRAIDINQDDIESITVLKGPAAAALYGTRAGAGAIVITTKKGSRGLGTSVHLRTTFEVSEVNKLPQLNQKYTQGLNGQYFAPGPNGGTSASWGALIDTMRVTRDEDGILQYDPAGQPMPRFNNTDNFFQIGTGLGNTVSVEHGTDHSAIRLSFGQYSQTGVVPKSDFQRYSFRVSLDQDLGKKIKLLATAYYVQSGGYRIQQGSNTSGVMLGLLRTSPSFDNSASYANPDGSQRTYAVAYDNPFWTVNRNPFTDKVNRLIGNIALTYDPTHWLNVTYRLGLDTYTDRYKNAFDKDSRNFPGGRVVENNYFRREIYQDILVTARKQFGKNWLGSLTVGNNLNERVLQRIYAQGTNLNIPEFYNISNTSAQFNYENFETIRIGSFFALAKLKYKDIFILNLTSRLETASTFGPEDRSNFYPSVNAGFIITELEGVKDSEFTRVLSFAKLRAAYSVVGQEPPPYYTRTYYSPPSIADGYITGVTFPYNGVAGYSVGDILGNSNLRPERVAGLELGTDLRFFKNRFGIDVTYYHQTTTNAIFNIPIAPSSGYWRTVGNAGRMINRGVEIYAYAAPIVTEIAKKRFSWDIEWNFTHNRNIVEELAPEQGINDVLLGGFLDSDIRAVAGQPYGQIYGTDFLRAPNGKLVIGDDGYPIMDPVARLIGNIQPDFLMGLRNTFSFENLSFGFLLDVRSGGQIWNGTLGALNFFGASAETENRGTKTVFDGVVAITNEDGSTSYQPNTKEVVLDQEWYRGTGSGFYGPNSQFVQDGSFVRLREISLAYSFKKVWKFIDQIDLGITGRNLALWTKYTGIDPETNLTGAGSNARGMDYFNMPNTRSMSFSVNFTFK